jgi:membrane-bound lytic murein transglycosylase D
LRLSFPALAAVVALALAACASPAPETDTAPEPAAVVGPPAPPVAEPLAAAPLPHIRGVFPPEISADLEPLPPPAEDLWVRIRKGYGMPDLDDPRVTKWEEWYASRPDYVARMVERSRRYLYYIVVEVQKRGMPLEIALLPMVESAYNPVAMSSAHASGIWQFTPGTGKVYGLEQNWWFDSRRDVIAATDGALTYLQKLHDQFEDWQLALAAYNWGEGNVARAIERNRKAGRPTDYASLKMPDETRNYLPKLQAVKNIVADPARFNLELADIPDAPYFAVVRTTREMDVKRAAELAEMPEEEFQYLNPHHNRPVIAGADEYAILLPIDKAELFAAKLELTDQPLVSWQAYRLRAGETMPQVAARFGMSTDTLLAVNGIGANVRVPAGQLLLVPSQRPTPETVAALTEAVFTTVPQGRTFYYRVSRGDTLSGIAARYDVSAKDLRRWNNINGSLVRIGQRLRITSDRAPNAKAATRAAGGKGRAPVAKAKSRPAKGKRKTGKRTAKRKRRAPVAKAKSPPANGKRKTSARPATRKSRTRAHTAKSRRKARAQPVKGPGAVKAAPDGAGRAKGKSVSSPASAAAG